MSKLAIPSMLSYARSINPTDGLMFGSDSMSEHVEPILVTRRTARSPLSNFSETRNAEKNPARSRPTEGDIAVLGPKVDTLNIQYSVVINGKSRRPHSCNNKFAETRDALLELTELFEEKGGYLELANRYLHQILSGAPAWRNLEMAECCDVTITTRQGSVSSTCEDGEVTVQDKKARNKIAERMAKALGSEKGMFRLNVVMKLPMAPMTEVFPSELFSDTDQRKQLSFIEVPGDNGKPARQAILHNQKIGNAIRTIDDWYDDDAPYAIAVEPYGIDQKLNTAVRIESHRHFYKLMTHHVTPFIASLKQAKSASDIPGDACFFVACLIRGGVFSAKDS